MNESIKFIKDSKLCLYAEDDTGTMIGAIQDYTGVPCGVVRLDAGAYVLAPFGDLEYVAAES